MNWRSYMRCRWNGGYSQGGRSAKGKLHASKSLQRMACGILAFLLLLLGCGPAKAKDLLGISPIPNRTAATPQVEAALSWLLAAESNEERRRALLISHQDWLQLRSSHCRSEEVRDSEENKIRLEKCYEAFDHRYIEKLNDERLHLLLNSPPRGSAPTRAIHIPYSEESTVRPSVVRSIAVASNAPIASVTHQRGGITETYDLVNGRLVSRIRTLDHEKIGGVYQNFLTPNGRILIASAHWPKSNIKIWDVQSGECLRESRATVYPRILTSDGRQFVFTQNYRIGIYDIVTRDTSWSDIGKESVSHIAVSPDDRWLIIVFEKRMESWQLVRAKDRWCKFSCVN